jgi:hypothetical protein
LRQYCFYTVIVLIDNVSGMSNPFYEMSSSKQQDY